MDIYGIMILTYFIDHGFIASREIVLHKFSAHFKYHFRINNRGYLM